jgi:glyoxylase-like metal-dependent hydrolase (beta-lactamase superfamily II)
MNKKTALIAVPIILFLLASVSFTQQRSSAPLEMKEIAPGLYELLGARGANGGVFIGDDGVLVIDAKQDQASVEATIAAIKKVTDKPIKYLVNTHSDGDHIAGNRFFPQTVTFIAHENCRKGFFAPGRSGRPSQWISPELAPFVPSITFSDKLELYLGEKKVELWYFGKGHTTGDCVVYFPEAKTAFLGDQVFLTRPQLIHVHKNGNSFAHVKTLTKMLDTLDAEKFCSGHSELANRKAVARHIAQMQARQQKVSELKDQDKSLIAIQKEFTQAESQLVQTIYNELK